TIAYTFLWQACTARVGICALICVPPQTTHAGIDQDALAPAFNNQARLVDTNEQLRAAIDAFIDKTYAVLSSPNLIAMLRLLIAESGRVPQLIQRWRDEVVLPHIAAQQQIVDQCV